MSGEHLELALRTQIPELREAPTVEDHDALIKRAWIQIVVTDIFENALVAAVDSAETKCAAFTADRRRAGADRPRGRNR